MRGLRRTKPKGDRNKAVLQDLIGQIEDPALRERIMSETNKLLKQKKFGLVFEEHLLECTPLYDIPYRDHLFVSEDTGTAKLKLNTWEQGAIRDKVTRCIDSDQLKLVFDTDGFYD